MVREIKFRAWDKRLNQYHHDVHLSPNFGKFINSTFYDLEQFTGLHDKNGKEIFEGDIVLHYSSGYSDRKYQLKYASKKIVVFENGTFKYAQKCPPESGFSQLVEVVGNIHETEVM